jgi:uncharacterized protein YndB with AHSA1/START domain
MGMTQVYRQIEPGRKLVCSEQFDDPWYEGEAETTIELLEEGKRTTVVQTMRYATQAIRDGILRSPAVDGVAESYDALETALAR